MVPKTFQNLEKVVSLLLNGSLKNTTNQIILMEHGFEFVSSCNSNFS